jgi:Na+/H+-translocating membrane pyrophosphatase
MANEQIVLEIKERVFNGERDLTGLLVELENKGYSNEEAKAILAAVSRDIKKDMFNKATKKNSNDEYAQAALVIIFMIALIPPVFDVQSPIVFFITAILAAITGYFGFKQSPIAGAISAGLAVFIFKYAYHFYFEGRESFIRIEILIPMLMAAAPVFILYLILSFILPKK